MTGSRVGKPIIIKSTAEGLPPAPGPVVRAMARWAGGGMSSKRASVLALALGVGRYWAGS